MDTGSYQEKGSGVELVSRSSVSSTWSLQWLSQDGAAPGSRRRRNEPCSWLRQRFQTSNLLLLIIFFACCIPLTSASAASPYNEIDVQMVEVVNVDVDVGSTSELLKSSLDRLARTGTLLVDHSPEPKPRNHYVNTNFITSDELRRRQDDPFGNQQDDSKSSGSKTAKSTSASATKSSASKTSSGAIAAATSPAAFQLPQPYDQGFSGNITESCSNFMYGFLRNSTFQSCLPFSMLLFNSNSFFDASKSVLSMTQTLDATCSADTTVCDPLMASLAANISSSDNCASDLANQNPLILDAELGLKAYKPLYSASCLRNPQTSSYCFADAITNASSPTDSYIYYLPLNISLPGGSQPTCNSCLKNSMAIFSAASSDRKSAIADTYIPAAQQINVQCGPGFVNSTLAPESKSSAHSVVPGFGSSNVGLFALTILVGSWLI